MPSPRHAVTNAWARRAVGTAVVTALLLGGTAPAEAAPTQLKRLRPDVHAQSFATGDTVPTKQRKADALLAAVADYPQTTPALAPATTSETLELDRPSSTTGAHAGLVKAASAPVWVGPATARSARKVAAPATRASESPSTVRLDVVSHADSRKAGVNGVLVKVRDAAKVESGAAAGQVAVQVDLRVLDPSGSGDWAQRAEVVSLPACAATTPEVPACQQQEPLPTSTDASGGLVTTKVAMTSTSASVLAVTAGASGSAGDYRASPMSPSGVWAAGGSGGGFSWTYPIRVPSVAGDVAPALALGYSSDAVDGRTASTNNQPSWVGEGWDLDLGSIERSYRVCEDDTGTGANNPGDRQDLCWAGDNATVSFGSHSGQLVQQGTSTLWRLREDDGTRFEKLTGALDGGDNDKEYWKVTTTDGTQYYFGRGKAIAASAATNSALQVPVYGNHAGEPCNQSSFSSSVCQQAWRWNLDYVVDTHGNSMTAYYTKETNRYGRNNNEASTSYNRASYLSRIDYGQQAGNETLTAPAKVTFDVAERCLTTSTQTCSELTASSASAWPDVPQDQLCDSTTSCSARVAPTFFTRKRLTAIKTWTLSGGTYAEVERWNLSHKFPDPGDGTSASLWLSSVTHAAAGGASPLPPVTFGPVQMANRVDGIDDTRGSVAPPLIKYRIASIGTESGGQIDVDYTDQDCSPTSLPAAQENNTRRCFPVYWSVPFADEPSLNWFHKYAVASVSQVDLTSAASPSLLTRYTYDGGAGWAYDDNKFIKAKHRTWSVWAGFGKVSTTVGTGSAAQRSSATYYRGLDGDRAAPSGGTKTVKVTDSEGVQVSDSRAFRGAVREDITYNGTAEVTASINDQTAIATTATNSDGRTAVLADVTRSRDRTRLADGSYRRGQTTTAYDSYGFVTQSEEKPDLAVTTDHTCTRTSYARSTSAWILGTPSLVESRNATCGGWPSAPTEAQVLEQTRHYYDKLPLGSVSKGDETTTQAAQSLTSGAFTWFDEANSTFDAVGRELTSTDALGRTTTTAYTPAGPGLVTATTITSPDPDGGTGPLTPHVVTTTLDPRWGAPTKTVAADGATTEATYDNLGRTTQIWRPGRSKSTQTPTTTFAYTVPSRAASAVTTKTLLPNESYLTTVDLYDGLLRDKQTQAQTIDRTVENGVIKDTTGRLVSDNRYDDRGLLVKEQGPTLSAGNPSTTYLNLADNQIPSQTQNTYDGAGRVTKQSLVTLGLTRWSTTTGYGGDRVSVTPPPGGTATTTITDAHGRTTALRQHTGASASGTYEESRYTYTPAGRLDTMTDAAGNVWRHTYDMLGRETRTDDPDSGRSTSTYDLADQAKTTTNARGQTLAYTYDALGRQTGTRDGSDTGSLRTSTTWDSVKKDHLASTSRYLNGQAITDKITAYDVAGRVLSSELIVPAISGWIEPALAKTYTTSQTYYPDGSPKTTLLPLTGNVRSENITYGYDAVGRPLNLGGEGAWVADSIRSGYGDLLQTTSGQLDKAIWTTSEIDDGTGRTTRIRLDRQTHQKADYDIGYSYEDAGAITKIAAQAPETGAAADTQCFRHDHVQRLVGAWTPASGDCTTSPTVSGLGGPAPYWQDWTFDLASNRTKEVSHAAAGDTTTSWTHPAQGSTAVRPHGALTQSVTKPGASTTSTQLAYDSDGNVTGRTSTANSVLKASAQTQSLTYDAEGRLAEAKTTGASPVTTRFAYDAGGDQLIRTDPGTTTLYLGSDELTLTKATSALTDARYYTFDGRTVAVRTGGDANSAASLWSDLNNTATWQVDWNTLAITTRRTLPYGSPRGTAPTAVKGQHGFVDGLDDADLGLVRLGARDYDPASGRFLSVDPLIDLATPQSWNGYLYGGGNPVEHPDPSGLMYMPGNVGPPSTPKPKPKPSKPHSIGSITVSTIGSIHYYGSGGSSSGGSSWAGGNGGGGGHGWGGHSGGSYVHQAAPRPVYHGPSALELAQKHYYAPQPSLNTAGCGIGPLQALPCGFNPLLGVVLNTTGAPAGFGAAAARGGAGNMGNAPIPQPRVVPRDPAPPLEGPGKKGGENSAAAYGRTMHKGWSYGEGYQKEFEIAGGKYRADAVNLEKRDVVELKSDNPKSILRGTAQARRYAKLLDEEFPAGPGEKPFTYRVESYDTP
jgi:RHS repeat-associated protein